MKKFFYSLFAALTLILFASCANTPSSVVTTYLDNFQKGDYAAMVDQMHFKKNMTDKDKAEIVSILEEKGKETAEKNEGIAGFVVVSEEIAEDGLTAKVNYTLTYGNGKTKDEDIKLVKVDNKWMLDSGK